MGAASSVASNEIDSLFPGREKGAEWLQADDITTLPQAKAEIIRMRKMA
jgi:hypothetical protein